MFVNWLYYKDGPEMGFMESLCYLIKILSYYVAVEDRKIPICNPYTASNTFNICFGQLVKSNPI